MDCEYLSCKAFAQTLVDQQPTYDPMILRDIRLTDSWIGNVSTGVFPAHQGVLRRIDRFRHVWPNTTKVWTAKNYASCVGEPCDKHRHCIGWGSERTDYYLEEQHWQTQLLCFEQIMHVTHAKEQFDQIIGDILRPTTDAINSMFLRKRALQHAGAHVTADGAMTPFTFAWQLVGDEEYLFNCSVPPTQVFKLSPQHLQVLFLPLMRNGYGGKNPFKETVQFVELVTSIETAWELERLAGQTGAGGSPTVPGNWRFTQWGDGAGFWKYGFGGQIGNFLVRTDWAELRFNFVQDLGAGSAPNQYQYQLILPYTNIPVGGAGGAAGIGSVTNVAFDRAQFSISFIMHKRAMSVLTLEASPISSEMPFTVLDYGGRWRFVMDNLGEDATGHAIENIDRNKGMFVASFELAIRPELTELMVAYFHKREPMCLPEIPNCHADPGYPTQDYASCTTPCDACTGGDDRVVLQ